MKASKALTWVCPFSRVRFCGAFRFQKIIFLQLFQIWSSYCFHCDTDQLWTHTQATTRQSIWNRFYWQSKIWSPICTLFGTKSYIYILLDMISHTQLLFFSFLLSFSWKLDTVGFCMVATLVHIVIAALHNVMPSCVLSKATFWQLYWAFFSLQN